MTEQQVKSKRRVADHGEVFTSEREVNAMLDLVKQETERIDSRFLEPACGTGNFLIEILRRKLAVVHSRYGKSPYEYEIYSLIALMSIYGVELLQDNVLECQERLFQLWELEYFQHCSIICSEECRGAALFILKRNILCGDALTLETEDGDPLIFSEWARVTGNLIKRRDFHLDVLYQDQDEDDPLFSTKCVYDEGVKAFVPKPIKEFPPTEYLRIAEYG